jgi:PAS domain S-box-containing protein
MGFFSSHTGETGLKNGVPVRKKPIFGGNVLNNSDFGHHSAQIKNIRARTNPEKINSENIQDSMREPAATSLESFKIIHVDDEPDQLTFTKLFLEQDPSFEITPISTATEALRLVTKGGHDCLILDYQMGEVDGITLARRVREKSRIPIIIYTGRGSEEVAEEAFSAGVDDYVRKELDPAHYKLLANRIRQAIVERRNEESYRNLFNNASEAIFIFTLDWKILDINEAACRGLGYAKEELLSKNLKQITTSDFFAIMPNLLKELQREDHLVFEFSYVARAGEVIPFEVSAKLVDYKGHKSILSFCRDLTERKSFEKQITTLHSHTASLAQATSYIAMSEATLDAVESVIGFRSASFLIADEGELISICNRGSPTLRMPLPSGGKSAETKRMMRKKQASTNDLKMDRGLLRSASDSMSTISIPVILEGELVALLQFEGAEHGAFDEADQRLLEILATHVASAFDRIRAMERMKKQELKSRELLDDAKDMVRQDLRHPLQTIQYASYLIRHKPDQYEELTRKIDESVENAVKILDDLKAVTETINPKKIPVDFGGLVERCLSDANIPTSVIVERKIVSPLTLEIDPAQIRCLVSNLVKNALEAMPGGGTLTVEVEGLDEMAELAVKDTGRRSSMGDVRNVFKQSHAAESSGEGLKLVICRKVVEAHGGLIMVGSKVGEGSTFTVLLPKMKRVLRDAEEEIRLPSN